MRVLLTGITGSIGSALAPRLLRDGHRLTGLTRREPERLPAGLVPAGVELVTGDALLGRGLDRALDGVEVAYYLIHSMDAAGAGDFATREAAAAERFVEAARAAGVRRLIYLGGLLPDRAPASAHLRSRLTVERTLLAGVPDSVAFRASIVIGARSRSFRFLVRLVERMPVMLIPAWRSHRTAPVDQRDVIECLARAARAAELGGRSLDIAGREVVTYGALIELIGDLLLLDRPVFNIPRVSLTPIASRVAALVAGEDHDLIGPLMEGLDSDLLPRHPTAAEVLGVRAHSLEAAIEHSLREWEREEELRAW